MNVDPGSRRSGVARGEWSSEEKWTFCTLQSFYLEESHAFANQ
jgi:hypothetical protein